MKFQWTTIQVTNLDKSLKFYKDLLGMKIAKVIEGGNHQIVMLGEDDDAKIELIPISTASRENYIHPLNKFHLKAHRLYKLHYFL